MMRTIAILLTIISLYFSTLAQALLDHCGTIGRLDETAATPSRAQQFYLDTANPAPCTGNVTSWRVCYYGPDMIESAGSYWASYAVYQRVGSGPNIRYVRVSEMFTAQRAVSHFIGTPSVDGEIFEGGFNCYNDIGNAHGFPFNLTIRAGEFIGACVFDPEGDVIIDSFNILVRLPLDVVGQSSNGGPLLQMSTSGCSTEHMPTDILANQLSTVSSRRLHIYTNIVTLPMAETTTPIPLTTTTEHIQSTTERQATTRSKPTTKYQITTTSQPTTEPTTEPTTKSPSTSAMTTAATDPLAMVSTDEIIMSVSTSSESTTDHDSKTSSDIQEMTHPMLNTTGSGESTQSGNLIIISVGVIAGLLLLIILGVAILAAAFYLLKSRQARKKDATGKTSNLNEYDDYSIDINDPVLRRNKDGGGVTTDGFYEVPMNSPSPQSRRVDDQYHVLAEQTLAVPPMYEYATSGPDELKVANDYNHKYFSLEEATESYSVLLERNKYEDIYGDVKDYYLQPATGEGDLYAQIRACGIKNIPPNRIQIKKYLGDGQFAMVEQGVWQDGARDIQVAVKLLKQGATETDKVKFLQEAAIMAQFSHPNVVSLYGVVNKTDTLILVVELIEKGDLRNVLQAMRPDPGELPTLNTLELLLNFCQQVALGMHYLSAKRFVHRDLAARNILVSRDNICKVADFGMSRDLADETYYVSQGGQIPIKWTAPEAIHYKKYSTASDVWSYGCLLYEIWSLGHKPFETIGNAKAIELVDSGKRLPPPPGCSRVIYEQMIKCWNPVAVQRPSFRKLLLTLLDDPEDVLAVPSEAVATYPNAGVLGSSLEAGTYMYRDLQDSYL